MALEYGLFNSTEIVTSDWGYPIGNKAKDASFFASLLSSLVKSGILPSSGENPFKVTPNEGSGVSVAPGKAFLCGYYASLGEATTLAVSAASVAHTYEIVLRLDLNLGEIRLEALRDPNDTIPLRNGTLYDLHLATVQLPAYVSQITAAMITDRRSDETHCGVGGVDCNVAEKWKNARTLSLSGGASGECVLDGSGDAELEVEEIDLDTASGILPVANGGTGGANAAAARANLGAASLAHTHTASVLQPGTLGKTVLASNDTDYTACRLRNIALCTSLPSSAPDGTVVLLYEA